MVMAGKHHDGTAKTDASAVRQHRLVEKCTHTKALETSSHTNLVRTVAGPRRASYEAGIRAPAY